MLRLVLPKGSLEKPTLELFEAADLRVVRSSTVDYKASIDDPRIDEVRILRPQEIPTYVAEGLFDLGIAGRDWVEETASDVTILGELQYSKASSQPFRIVLAVPQRLARTATVADLPQGVRVSSEYPELTRQFFEKHGIQADIRLSYGATEAKVPDIVDCIVDGTETGRALRAAGLKIIGDVLTSYTALVANPAAVADPAKQHAMEQIKTLLDGVMEARGQGAREAERRPRRPRRGHRAAAVDEVADGVRAVRRGRLRGGDRRRQGHDQHADPRPQGRRRQRHHRAAARQDRPLMEGTVIAFDEPRGLGTIEADGTEYPFHCTALLDGTRTIEVGTAVTFEVRPAAWAAGRRPRSPQPVAEHRRAPSRRYVSGSPCVALPRARTSR